MKESTIDDKVVRLLRTVLRYGFLDRPQFDPADSTYSVADRAVALDGARESLTLLKNDGHLLPLDPAKVKTIAIIGPDAWPAVTGGGGSSEAHAFEPVGILTGVANQAGPDVHVLYSRGLPEMNEVFRDTQWESGVTVSVFPSNDFGGNPEIATQPYIGDFQRQRHSPRSDTPQSIRYTASYKAPKTGSYILLEAFQSWDGDEFKITVDGKPLPVPPHAEGQAPQSWTLDLKAGQTVNIVAECVPASSTVHFGLGIAYEPELVSAEAKQFAKLADVVVVATGFNPTTEGEGYDRTFALPWGQDALIEAVAAANPRTIVTLTGGGGMDTRRWLDKVPALLHTYYPGQEGGTAVGEVLFGKRNPEGKLPVSFDRSWDENPSAQYYYPVKDANTSLHVTENGRPPVDYVIPSREVWRQTDGWLPLLDHHRQASALSLRLRAELHHLQLFQACRFRSPQPPAPLSTVSFDITNTGTVAGAEVAQLYVSDPSTKVLRPERELKGFEKVRLAPGETRHITLNLDARAFSYWDEAAHKWAIDPGKFVIRVGDSSEYTPLHAELTINGNVTGGNREKKR